MCWNILQFQSNSASEYSLQQTEQITVSYAKDKHISTEMDTEPVNTEPVNRPAPSNAESTSEARLKRKTLTQDDFNMRMLKMAKKEHQLKMQILKLKKEYIEAKKYKLEEKCVCRSNRK